MAISADIEASVGRTLQDWLVRNGMDALDPLFPSVINLAFRNEMRARERLSNEPLASFLNSIGFSAGGPFPKKPEPNLDEQVTTAPLLGRYWDQ